MSHGASLGSVNSYDKLLLPLYDPSLSDSDREARLPCGGPLEQSAQMKTFLRRAICSNELSSYKNFLTEDPDDLQGETARTWRKSISESLRQAERSKDPEEKEWAAGIALKFRQLNQKFSLSFVDRAVSRLVAQNLKNSQPHPEKLPPVPKPLPRPPLSAEQKAAEGALAFYKAIRIGDVAACRKLIDLGVDINARIELGADPSSASLCVPLLLAVEGRQTEVCRLLISKGVKLDPTTYRDYSALHLAAANGDWEICDLLIKAGAEIDPKTDKKVTPLHLAAEGGHADICTLLLKAGVSVDWLAERGQSALCTAAAFGHTDVCAALIAGGAQVDLVDAELDTATALNVAAVKGHAEICALLLEAGAQVNWQKHKKGQTALHAAAYFGYMDVCIVLIAFLAQLDLTSAEQGRAPLHYAITKNHVEICALLLEAGASVDLQIKTGISALALAAAHGHVEICDLLLKQKANINLRAENGSTPLHFAANAEICNLLLDNWANIHAISTLGDTPLHKALSRGCLDTALALIQRRAVIDLQNPRWAVALSRLTDVVFQRDEKLLPLNQVMAKLIGLKGELGGAQDLEEIALDATAKGSVKGDAHALEVAKPPFSQYRQVYHLLTGVQILQKHRTLLERLNNGKEYWKNPAAQIAFAISGQVLHLDDSLPHVEHFIDLVSQYFEQAQKSETPDRSLVTFFKVFYSTPFPCFDARITELQEYGKKLLIHPDFSLEFVSRDPDQLKAGQYFRVFRNLQIEEMANKEPRTIAKIAKKTGEETPYQSLQSVILQQTGAKHKDIEAVFYMRYCTLERALQYLTSQSASAQATQIIAGASYQDFFEYDLQTTEYLRQFRDVQIAEMLDKEPEILKTIGKGGGTEFSFEGLKSALLSQNRSNGKIQTLFYTKYCTRDRAGMYLQNQGAPKPVMELFSSEEYRRFFESP